jgi:hypothetical protein
MALFNFEIQMATGCSDDCQPAWELFAKINALLEDSEMQLNYAIMKKDGKQIPTTREGMERKIAYDKAEARREADELVRQVECQLAEARKKAAQLK